MKTPLRLIWALLSPFTCFPGLPAQAPAFRLEELSISTASPLATIDCIFEDRRGFLWFGAYTGLYRFDGYDLLHFRHDPNDSLSISDNKIQTLLEDPQGNLWVGTQVGLNHFNLHTGRFTAYTDTLRSGLGKIGIFDLKYDTSGTLWVGASDGLYRFDAASRRFFRLFPQAGSVKIVSIVPHDQGAFVCSAENIYFVDKNTGESRIIPSAGTTVSRRIFIQKDREGVLWAGTDNGLFWYDPAISQGLTEVPAFRGKTVNFVSGAGPEWLVNTSQGMIPLNTRTRQAGAPIVVQVNGVNRPVDDLKLGYTSSSDVTWFFSAARKIYKADRRKERFQHTRIDLMEPLKEARAFCELHEFSPGKLLIPRKEGASLLDLSTGNLTRFPYAPSYNQAGWAAGMTSFMEEKDGSLWIGAVGGLFLFDRNRQRFIDLEADFKELARLRNVCIRKIHRDKAGRLWVATWANGLFKINFPERSVQQYNYSDADRVALRASFRSILETRGGDLWFGTRGGLLKYIEPADSFQVYHNIPNVATSMSENTAFCIYEDAEGNIWSGSYGGGLNRLDVRTGAFKHYTSDNGLLNNNVFSLLPDGNHNLWLAGYTGLTKLIPSLDSFQTFTHHQGLLNHTLDGFLYGRSRFSNTFFFGGTLGVDRFNPDSIFVSAFVPKVWLTDFKLFNESVPVAGTKAANGKFALEQDIGFTRHITLRYDQNVLTFEYAALDYSSPQTVRYAYKLEGFDKTWQYVGDKRSITFTNLNPGTYTFRVKASNGDGFWPPDERNVASILLTITPPWWRTWWFNALAALSLAGLITAFYRYRIRQVREKEAIKTSLNQRIAHVKMEALRSQMNPHFVFNCLSSLKLFVEKNETEKASDHISKFATLLRRVLDDARTDTETVTLERELDTLRRYVELEMIRFKDKFEFRMDLDPEMDLQSIEIPPLILQPYVENAILHGLQHKTDGKGLLLVQVKGNGHSCQVAVEDNGIGREAARAIKERYPILQVSHGLNVTAERLEYFSQKYQTHASVETTDLVAPDGAAMGTRLTLTFQTN